MINYFSFLRNGVALVKSDDYTFESGKGLTFSRYNSSDSGIFQCVAFNSAHWKQKMTFVMITGKKIYVFPPRIFIQISTNNKLEFLLKNK